jgi:hypothetical protein
LLAPAAARVAHLVKILDHRVHHAAGAAAAGEAVEARADVLRVAANEPALLEALAACLRKSGRHGSVAHGALTHSAASTGAHTATASCTLSAAETGLLTVSSTAGREGQPLVAAAGVALIALTETAAVSRLSHAAAAALLGDSVGRKDARRG